jgi:predicted dehydrogenase
MAGDNALLIGCGNIGAQYDLGHNEVLTHAKAYHKLGIKFSVFDLDHSLARKIAETYGVKQIENFESTDLEQYGLFSICTPTSTHYDYLKKLLALKGKVIICEKPVSSSSSKLNELKKIYSDSGSQVLVNYLRRFQPAYFHLREFMKQINVARDLRSISIHYCRGFLNNCSHALDTIEFLTEKKTDLSKVQITKKEFDVFRDDPTLSLEAEWNNAKIEITGHTSRQIFEIHLQTGDTSISISDSGRKIAVNTSSNTQPFLLPLNLQENCLRDYMLPVIQHAKDILQSPGKHDNFIDSCDLNLKMLNLI